MRRAGLCVSSGEIDADVVGVAAPILSKAPGLLASLSLVLPLELADEALVARIAAATMEGARRIEVGVSLIAGEESGPPAAFDAEAFLSRMRGKQSR